MANIRTQVVLPIQHNDQSVEATLVSFSGLTDHKEHIALCFGAWQNQALPVVRVHSECLTGDVFHSARCDCGSQLHEAIEILQLEGGVLLYLRQEGRGIGLYNKIDAYALQERGLNTLEANTALSFPHDVRNYSVAAEMLQALGINEIILLTNNHDKVSQLTKVGITVQKRRSTSTHLTDHNRRYLDTKRTKCQHFLEID